MLLSGIQNFSKDRKVNLFFIFCIIILSVYPIYRNFYYGYASLQYERHVAFLNVETQFHNPWQYRILAPLSVEVIKRVYDNTIDKIFPIEENLSIKKTDGFEPRKSTVELLNSLKNPDFIKYNIIYVGYRFVLNIITYLLCFLLFLNFTKNRWLIFFGLSFVALSLGNAVNDSDFVLHTYIDVILYLFAGLIILNNKNGWYIVLLTVIGALNRETCLLIPFLYLMSNINWLKWQKHKFALNSIPFPVFKTILITSISVLLYAFVFVSIRVYYGYEPATPFKASAGFPMFKLNFFSLTGIKSYFEMIGVFTVIPLLCLLKFKSINWTLRIWFIAIVPIWFSIHFFTAVAYQARLFLVPTLLIFIPIMLSFIENEFQAQK